MNTKMDGRLSVALILALFLCFFTFKAVTAQEPPLPPPGHPEFGKRFDTLRMVKLVDLLGLDEKQAATLASKFGKHREEMTKAMEKLKEVRAKLEESVKASPKDKKLDELIATFKDSFKQMGQLREKHMEEVLKMLTSEQKAKFLLFQEQFPRELRKHMMEMRDGRRGNRQGRFNNPADDPDEESYVPNKPVK